MLNSMFNYFTKEYLQEKIDTNKQYIVIEGHDKYWNSLCMSFEDTVEFVCNQKYELIYLDAGKGLGSLMRMVFKKVN